MGRGCEPVLGRGRFELLVLGFASVTCWASSWLGPWAENRGRVVLLVWVGLSQRRCVLEGSIGYEMVMFVLWLVLMFAILIMRGSAFVHTLETVSVGFCAGG